MNRREFLLLALAPLPGCGGVSLLPSYDDLSADKSGVAIACVGGQWFGNARFRVWFRPVASPSTVGEFYFLRTVGWPFKAPPTDIADDGVYATVATRRLPPGMYEIYGADVHIFIGAHFYYGDKRPFTYQFEIVPGKATYLGEFMGFPARGKDENLGTDTVQGSYFTVRNRVSRDLELLRKRGVEFPPDQVIISVMTKAQSADSIFRRLDDAS